MLYVIYYKECLSINIVTTYISLLLLWNATAWYSLPALCCLCYSLVSLFNSVFVHFLLTISYFFMQFWHVASCFLLIACYVFCMQHVAMLNNALDNDVHVECAWYCMLSITDADCIASWFDYYDIYPYIHFYVPWHEHLHNTYTNTIAEIFSNQNICL